MFSASCSRQNMALPWGRGFCVVLFPTPCTPAWYHWAKRGPPSSLLLLLARCPASSLIHLALMVTIQRFITVLTRLSHYQDYNKNSHWLTFYERQRPAVHLLLPPSLITVFKKLRLCRKSFHPQFILRGANCRVWYWPAWNWSNGMKLFKRCCKKSWLNPQSVTTRISFMVLPGPPRKARFSDLRIRNCAFHEHEVYF